MTKGRGNQTNNYPLVPPRRQEDDPPLWKVKSEKKEKKKNEAALAQQASRQAAAEAARPPSSAEDTSEEEEVPLRICGSKHNKQHTPSREAAPALEELNERNISKRTRVQYQFFYEKELEIVKKENPRQRLSHYNHIVMQRWKVSPDNPLVQFKKLKERRRR